MSYSYRARKKAIKRHKKEFASELKFNQLPPELMPGNAIERDNSQHPLGRICDWLGFRQ